MDVFENIAKYFDLRAQKYAESFAAADWASAKSQELRFKILSEVGDMSGSSVLDVGCGTAGFSEYINNKYQNVEYFGIDLSEKMLERAKSNYPKVKVMRANILEIEGESQYDYIVANGIFYLLGKDGETLSEMLIDKMYKLAKKAVAFNSLSSWANSKNPNEFYAEPAKMLNFCRQLTARLVLRHDYHPADFCIYMYKEAWP